MDDWMDRLMDGWMDGQTNGKLDGQTDGSLDDWMDKQMDDWMDKLMGDWVDRQMDDLGLFNRLTDRLMNPPSLCFPEKPAACPLSADGIAGRGSASA